MNKLQLYIQDAVNESHFSHDEETKIGCILLNRKNERVVMSSSNRFIGSQFKEILPNLRPGKYHYIQHAEQRLIFDCARLGTSTQNAILISTHSPCGQCALALFQAGITTIYCKTMRPETELINDRLDLKATLKKLKSGIYKLKLSLR